MKKAIKIITHLILITSAFFYFFISTSIFSYQNSLFLEKINTTQTHSEVTFKANHPIKYTAFPLSNPTRAVFDIKEGQFNKRLIESPFKTSNIQRMRIGQYKASDLRIVFDLKKNLKIDSYLKKDGEKSYILTITFDELPKNSLSTQITTHQLREESKTSPLLTQNQVKKVTAPPALPIKMRDIVIVVDPGHGGKDPGAIGPKGVYEKDIVLKISKELVKLINREPGFKAVLTRKKDYYLNLRERLTIARRYKPDLFVAIHADAYKNREAFGASIFALSAKGATSEAAKWLAEKENQSELMGGVELSDKDNLLKSVLINLSQNATIRSSLGMGMQILNSMGKITSLHHDKVEQAAFIVLKSPDIPSLLVETGFISNRSEAKRLKDRNYQLKVANAIKKGIKNYFTLFPPPHTHLYAAKNSQLYYVKAGDNLSLIAKRFNTSVEKLMTMNQLNSSKLRVGQKLLILQ